MTKGHHVLFLDPSWEVNGKKAFNRSMTNSVTSDNPDVRTNSPKNRTSQPTATFTLSEENVYQGADNHLGRLDNNNSAPVSMNTANQQVAAELATASIMTAGQIEASQSGLVPESAMRTFTPAESFPISGERLRPATGNTSPLDHLVSIIADLTESYTSAVFVTRADSRKLSVASAQTLSREFMHNAEIDFGSGLVGWTAENRVRISVCPFEHDSTTLLYYSKDQALKSFIAVPIITAGGLLRGVIACDSKKSYAFSKLAEKVLLECAAQAACIIEMEEALQTKKTLRQLDENLLRDIKDAMRQQETEQALLEFSAKLPQELVRRDSLIVITTAESGVGEGQYFTIEAEGHLEHRLLDLVYKHKKVICGERTVHVLPTNNITERSFLSVPFHVLGKEAGSFNLLNKPQASFEASEIAALESIARTLGRELEHIRLRDRMSDSEEREAQLSWKHFSALSRSYMEEAREAKISVSALRVQFSNLGEIEARLGINASVELDRKVRRLISQVKGHGAIACSIFGSQHLVFLHSHEVDRVAMRLQTMIKRIKPAELCHISTVSSTELTDLLISGMKISVADSSSASATPEELIAATNSSTPEVTQSFSRAAKHVRA
ncbi:MAG: GAF domain-containing protein [bacterium]|nr:GAF domain-containing protein [bacterium]